MRRTAPVHGRSVSLGLELRAVALSKSLASAIAAGCQRRVMTFLEISLIGTMLFRDVTEESERQ